MLRAFRGSFLGAARLHTAKDLVYSKNKSVVLRKWPLSAGIGERQRRRRPLWCLFVYDIDPNMRLYVEPEVGQQRLCCSPLPVTQTSEGVVKPEL